jgi:hypothetical protein
LNSIESTLASCSKSLLDKIDNSYDINEMRLSQTCKDIEEQRVVLRKQCEEAENLLKTSPVCLSLTQTLFKSKGDIISH